jgi:hypothetical protein
MRTKDDAIPQAVLDSILARALAAPPDPELKPLVAIQRIFCHRARVSDLPAGASMSVSVYDEIRRKSATLGDLVSTRHVGPFVVRLVRAHEGDLEFWQIVETDSRNQRVILLTYDSEGERAREDAARYASDATEVDLTSDFSHEAHFFGERRLPRVPGSDAS